MTDNDIHGPDTVSSDERETWQIMGVVPDPEEESTAVWILEYSAFGNLRKRYVELSEIPVAE